VTGHDRRPPAVPAQDGTAEAQERVLACTVVVVSYNSAADLPGLLESLKVAASDVDLRIMVVDNASSDGSAELVRARGVECVDTGANLGYAGAINVARRQADPDLPLLILNPDVEMASVGTLLRALDHPGVGIAVPLLLDADGSVYPSLRREPSVLRALGDACLGSHWPRRPAWASEMVRDDREYTRTADVDWATGAVMLFSAACHRAVGDWDESFFLYAEEVDVAARARRAGFAVRFVPGAVARHRQGGSGTSPALMALMTVNRVRYFRKHHAGASTAVFRGVVALHELLRSRDPDHRAALRTVLREDRWSALPRATAAVEAP